jgi:peptidyl-prolyl cis-trans isomerase D
MLQSMRQLAHSWVVKSLMLFLIVSFSIWGIGDIFRGNSLQKTVAKIGDTEISVSELNRLFEKALAEARQKYDPNLTSQQARQMGLLDQALQREISRQLIDMDIKRQGINVGPDVILKMLSEESQFRSPDGSFNKQLFRQILDRERLSESAFIAQGQRDLERQILVEALEGATFAPQTEVDALFKGRAQKRILDVVTVDEAKLGGIPAPEDNALRAFYNGNQQMFSAPEYRGMTIATLSTEALAKEIPITDDQVKKEYEAKLDQLSTPERRDIVQVVLQDEEKAKQLAKEARASGDLPAAAKALKETAVPLDRMEKDNLMPNLSKAVFALREGGIGDPVKTQLGWHVVQLKKIEPAGKPNFDKLKDKLREDMRRDQSIEAATRIVNSLDDQLAAGHSLDDIADGLRLRLIKIPAVDSNGMQPNGKEPSEFPNKEEVLKFAFAQSAGETSPVEDDKSGAYYVVRTDDITPSGVRPFGEVKDKVAAAWKVYQQQVKAHAEADKIIKGLRDGAAASSFNKDDGVNSRESSPLSLLGDTDKQLPPSLVARAFRLKKGETASEENDNKQIIVRLASVVDIDASKPDARKDAISAEIKKAEGNELIEQYVQHLHTIFSVKANADLLDQLRQKEE